MVEDFDVEMIVLLKFEVDENQLKDQNKETITEMHKTLQKYAQNAVEIAVQEDGGTPLFKVIESACAVMFPDGKHLKKPSKGLDGPPKMTGGEGK